MAPSSAHEETESVKRLFGTLLDYGSILGCRLLYNRPGRHRWYASWFKKLLLLFIIFVYLFGMSSVLLAYFPHPSEPEYEIRFDIQNGFLFVCIMLSLDGAGCLVTLNHATEVIARPNGFCDQIELYLNSRRSTVDWRPWKKLVRLNFFRCSLFTVFYVCVIVCHMLDYGVPYPIRYERIGRWLGVSATVAKGVFHTLGFMTFFHASYHGNLFSSLCSMMRLQFADYNHRVNKETAETFTTSHIGSYQAEYGRLAEMTDCLDRAFKHACFCQLFLFTTTTCFNLFLFTRSGLDVGTGFVVCFPFTMIVVSFLYTIVPAIYLKAEAEKPRKYLRLWYLKYELACDRGGKVARHEERQAIGTLMQWIALENVGITVSNLARLDAPLLLNVGSVVITYFLVILQFTTNTENQADLSRNLSSSSM